MTRRWWTGAAILALLIPSHAPAQTWAARLGLGADFWRLDPGEVGRANTRIGPTAHLVLEHAGSSRAAAFVTAGFAPQATFTPGLVSGAIGGLARLLPHRRDKPNLHVGLGLGMLWFNASNAERAIRECTPDRGCLFEGVGFASGARTSAIGRAGVEIPAGRITVLPSIELWQRLGSGRAGPAGIGSIWRAGLSVIF